MASQADHETRISARALSKGQRSALRRILNFYQNRNSYNGCTSVRFKMTRPYDKPSIVVTTRRSDCGRHSPRAVVSDQRAHIMLGLRGGITLFNSRSGLNDDSKHVKNMLAAK